MGLGEGQGLPDGAWTEKTANQDRLSDEVDYLSLVMGAVPVDVKKAGR